MNERGQETLVYLVILGGVTVFFIGAVALMGGYFNSTQWQESWECDVEGTVTTCEHTGSKYSDCHSEKVCLKEHKVRELVK